MTPTAVSQILEALCKLVFGLALSLWLLKIGQPDYIAAAGAIGGVTIGTILSLVYMAANYLRHRPALQSGERCASGRAIVRRLLALAIPITIASSMVSILSLIHISMCLRDRSSSSSSPTARTTCAPWSIRRRKSSARSRLKRWRSTPDVYKRQPPCCRC